MKTFKDRKTQQSKKSELNSLKETAYLLSNPSNARRLLEGIKQADATKNSVKRKLK
jgi:PHD/YefM family antitoxin component YafN of YafNO toxin-antitoxin module